MAQRAQIAASGAPRGRVAARKVRLVVELGARAGLDRARILAEIGLRPEDLADPDNMVPQSAWRAVWEVVARHTGDEAIGLRAGGAIEPGYFGVIDYAARACATLGQAIPLAARYFRLANTWGQIRVREDDGLVVVSRHILGDEGLWLPRQASDFALTVMLRVMRLAAARPLPVVELRLRHATPADPRPWTDSFGCPVRFGAAEDAIVVPRAALDIPMRAPDTGLRQIVLAHAEHLLAALEPETRGVAERVRHEILARLAARSAQPVELGGVARALGFSERGLQRQLAEEKLSFRALLEEARATLGKRWLSEGLAPGEVAFLLGYSTNAAFYRAFRAWTDMTPGAWARQAPKAT